jgi:predicted GIY-YIG superfamily endonuclease
MSHRGLRGGYVYTLRLEDDCWYVGFSTDPETRIASHFLGRGAQWTRAHKPVSVHMLQPGDERLESLVTIATMALHGWRKVRGSQWLAVQMPCAPVPLLKALSIRPPAAAPEQVEALTILGHSVVIHQLKDVGLTSWRARVSGKHAATACPKRGFKSLYAATEAEALAAVEVWLGSCRGAEEEESGEEVVDAEEVPRSFALGAPIDYFPRS